MRIEYKASDPDEIETTLSITMKIGEWKSLLLKLDESSWPASLIGTRIRNMISSGNLAMHETSSAEGWNKLEIKTPEEEENK